MRETLPSDLTLDGLGVYYSKNSLVTADENIVSSLKEAAAQSSLRRARLCAHPSVTHNQHDMLIASHRDTYVIPHRHLKKTETLVVIEGQGTLVTFDTKGEMTLALHLSPQQGGGVFFYRMPEGIFHTLLIKSDFLIFVESTIGPFKPDETEIPSWAPATYSSKEIEAYRKEITAKAALFLE